MEQPEIGSVIINESTGAAAVLAIEFTGVVDLVHSSNRLFLHYAPKSSFAGEVPEPGETVGGQLKFT